MKAIDAAATHDPIAGGSAPLHPAACACHPPRRGFLTGLAAAGAAALLPGCVHPMLPSAVNGRRVDVHQHFFPPTLLAEMSARGLADATAAAWSPARALDDMQQAGVAKAMLSLTAPAAGFADAQAALRLARDANEHAARLGTEHAGRFGSFAALPMPDVEASLKEIEYALDTLKADGVAVLSSYGDRWLGHESFAPVMDELNRRKAVLYVHSTEAACCRPAKVTAIAAAEEFGGDITRTIASLLFSGTATRCRDMRFIFSHAGGTLPFLVERLEHMPVADRALAPSVPDGVRFELKRFYYDTAWAAHPGALASLLKLVSVQQVLFGSDYPFRSGTDNVNGLTDYGLRESELYVICYDNARRLLRSLQQA
jgi:predicted TIM-barrel fold metal-dependent hydrolase